MQTDAYLANSKFSIAVLAPDNTADVCSSCNPFLDGTVSIMCLVESKRAPAFVWSHKQARLGSVQDLGQVGRQVLCHCKRKPVRVWGNCNLALRFWMWVSTQPFFLHMETVPILDVVMFESTA